MTQKNKKKEMSDKEKIIQSVLDELNEYEARFWAKEKMEKEERTALKSRKKTEGVSGSQLGYLKLRMKEKFVNELENLKNNEDETDPQDVISAIMVMIKKYGDRSADIRTYTWTKTVVGDSGNDNSADISEFSHGKGRLETIFDNIRSRLHSTFINYAMNPAANLTYDENIILLDIDKQIEKIEENGDYNYKTKEFKCLSPEKYIHKHNVLLQLRKYLLQHPDRDSERDHQTDQEFAKVLNTNTRYNDSMFWRSDTGKLLDRVLALKHKNMGTKKKNKDVHVVDGDDVGEILGVKPKKS